MSFTSAVHCINQAQRHALAANELAADREGETVLPTPGQRSAGSSQKVPEVGDRDEADAIDEAAAATRLMIADAIDDRGADNDGWLMSCDAKAKPERVVATLQRFLGGKELLVLEFPAELFESQQVFQVCSFAWQCTDYDSRRPFASLTDYEPHVVHLHCFQERVPKLISAHTKHAMSVGGNFRSKTRRALLEVCGLDIIILLRPRRWDKVRDGHCGHCFQKGDDCSLRLLCGSDASVWCDACICTTRRPTRLGTVRR